MYRTIIICYIYRIAGNVCRWFNSRKHFRLCGINVFVMSPPPPPPVLRGELQASSSRATELEQEVEVLEGELSASQQAAKVAPTRTMKSLVERLRSQLSAKEKQHRVCVVLASYPSDPNLDPSAPLEMLFPMMSLPKSKFEAYGLF